MKLSRSALKDITGLYRRLMVVMALNVPVIWGILLLDVRGVKLSALSAAYFTSVAAGYYMLPLLLLVTVIFAVFFAAKRVVTWLVGIVVVFFAYFLLLDSFVYEICKLHIDLFWLEFVLEDYQGLGLPTSTLLSALAALVAVIVVELGIFALSRRISRPRHVALPLFALAILAFGFSQVAHIVAYKRNDARITSLTPRFPFYVPFTSHRNADKFGELMPLGEPAAAAEALAPRIRVNAVALGAILPPPGKDSDYLRALAKEIPLQRVGEPDLVASTVLHLLGNDFITGEIVRIDGGAHLR